MFLLKFKLRTYDVKKLNRSNLFLCADSFCVQICRLFLFYFSLSYLRRLHIGCNGSVRDLGPQTSAVPGTGPDIPYQLCSIPPKRPRTELQLRHSLLFRTTLLLPWMTAVIEKSQEKKKRKSIEASAILLYSALNDRHFLVNKCSKAKCHLSCFICSITNQSFRHKKTPNLKKSLNILSGVICRAFVLYSYMN